MSAKKECDKKSCNIIYDGLNHICTTCDKLIDPDCPPYHEDNPKTDKS